MLKARVRDTSSVQNIAKSNGDQCEDDKTTKEGESGPYLLSRGNPLPVREQGPRRRSKEKSSEERNKPGQAVAAEAVHCPERQECKGIERQKETNLQYNAVHPPHLRRQKSGGELAGNEDICCSKASRQSYAQGSRRGGGYADSHAVPEQIDDREDGAFGNSRLAAALISASVRRLRATKCKMPSCRAQDNRSCRASQIQEGDGPPTDG